MKSIKEATDEAGVLLGRNASAHQRLNDATECLQYACGLTDLLAELLHEPDIMNPQRTSLTLGAIGALANLALQGAVDAQERMVLAGKEDRAWPLDDDIPSRRS